MSSYNKILIIILLISFLSSCAITGRQIGGETDEHGCFIGAGYSWCEAKQKCIRVWEENCTDITIIENEKKAENIAVNYIINTDDYIDYEGQNLIITNIETYFCEGCYRIIGNYQLISEKDNNIMDLKSFEILLNDWKIVDSVFYQGSLENQNQNIKPFCGISTNEECELDIDCVTSGCSQEICKGKYTEEIISTCDYKECYNNNEYGYECKCLNNECKWV
ncbi:MAG: eight-cysteine-cluster domain-containing protein [Nanoarchaeota archaeon]